MPVDYEIVTYNGQKARKYPNGAIRDNNGRILKPQPGLEKHQITTENTREYTRLRQEKRARIIAESANLAVQNVKLIQLYGDDAWIAEIGYNQQIKATTPDDPKSTAAANFMFLQSGIGANLGNNEVQAPQADTIDAVSGLIEQVRGLLDDVIKAKTGD